MITPAPVSTYSIISAATSKPVRRTVDSPTRKGDIGQSKDFADVNVFFIRVFLIAHSIARSTPLEAFRLARERVSLIDPRVLRGYRCIIDQRRSAYICTTMGWPLRESPSVLSVQVSY